MSGYHDMLARMQAEIESRTPEQIAEAEAKYKALVSSDKNAYYRELRKLDSVYVEQLMAKIKKKTSHADIAGIIGESIQDRFHLAPIDALHREPLRCIKKYGLHETINAAIAILRGGPDKFDEPLGVMSSIAKRLHEMGK